MLMTLIVMEGCARQLFFLKSFLQRFSNSTSLTVNYSKSLKVPINISDDNVFVLAQTFGCSIGSLPFTYLGLPLGLSKLKVDDFLPLVTRCERRLVSTTIHLSQAGRLQMTNAIFSALPTFYLCTFKVHQIVIDQINECRKHCLWRGGDLNVKSPPKAAWEMVCLPKTKGGLGVLQSHTHNDSLLIKNLTWEKYYSNGRLANHTKKVLFCGETI
jgi:hypothetical protein